MKKSIVYVSGTGNTKMLAEKIEEVVGGCDYVGGPDEKAQIGELIYVGFWTAKYTCTPDIEAFLKSLSHKKIFLFGTAGYDNSEAFFEKILASVAENINETNEIVGKFMCQGKVSEAKKQALQKMDEAKFNGMKAKIEEGDHRPNEKDLKGLEDALK